MFAVVPAICFILISLAIYAKYGKHDTPPCRRSALLSAAVVFGVLLVAATEVLSIFNLITFGWILGFWVLACLVCVLWTVSDFQFNLSPKLQGAGCMENRRRFTIVHFFINGKNLVISFQLTVCFLAQLYIAEARIAIFAPLSPHTVIKNWSNRFDVLTFFLAWVNIHDSSNKFISKKQNRFIFCHYTIFVSSHIIFQESYIYTYSCFAYVIMCQANIIR